MRSGFQGQTGKQTKHRLDHFRVVEHTYWFIIENLRKLLILLSEYCEKLILELNLRHAIGTIMTFHIIHMGRTKIVHIQDTWMNHTFMHVSHHSGED